ncbi:MAG: 2-oxo acid dehydrogenase subunit E2, partial [Thermoflexales bacterium]
MATNITMPQMGFDMTEGTIANWLKNEGDPVLKGDAIAEIETDKTTIQIEAFASGVLTKIVVPAGGKVPVGATIGIIGDAGEAVAAAAPASPAPEKAQSPGPVPERVEGVEAPAPVAIPVPAPVAVAPASAAANATPVARRMAEEMGIDLGRITGSGRDGQITKGDVDAHLASAKAAPAPAVVPVPAKGPERVEGVEGPKPAATGRVIASPAAKAVAAEKGVDLRQVVGSGPEGRVMKADVEAAPAKAPTSTAPVVAVAAPVSAAVATPPAAGDTRKPLSRMRQIIATRTQQSKANAPHFYITVAVEMDAAFALRTQVNESLKAEGVKVSVNDLVVRAVALALKKYPGMNSSFAGDAIETHGDIHVGNAVSLENGLITVTVRDADKKTLKQISVEMTGLASRAKSGKTLPGDAGGQTFSISNLGMYGVENFIAIINGPDAGILAVAAAKSEAVVRDGQIVIRSIMRITLSGDHRVTDGAAGADFVNEVKRLLENPWSL